MAKFLNGALVFAATGIFCYLVIGIVSKYMQENLERNRNLKYEELKLFIAPAKLMSIRIFAFLLTFCIMFIGQLAFGVEKMVIAVPVSLGFSILANFCAYWFYWFKLLRRKELFESQILDFAMGLANGMRSGLALGQALEMYAKRCAPPMSDELKQMIQEYRLGVDLPEAFERLQKRMPCEDLHLLTTTVTLTTKSGGSLVEVLEKMVATIRSRTEFQERLKNMTAQGKYEALAISCAPAAAFVILYLVDSDLMKPLVTTGTGWLAVGGATVLVTIGYFVLKKIITVEV